MKIRQRSAALLFAMALVVWCLGFSVAPVFETLAFGESPTDALYASVCHQNPERSFDWFGVSWGVCHRCSAIYLSFMLTALILIGRNKTQRSTLPTPRIIAALLAPVVLDALTDLLGLRDADIVSRIVTGTLSGVVLALVVTPLLFDALEKLNVLNKPPSARGSHV
jgi:uncharacterized membrane protein